jgi:biotin-dependent carboxylase-like uncharacterized protein
MIEVLDAGPLATIQDGGRPGYAALGVARSGAFDRGALELANRLVGNRPDAAVIEATLGGLGLRLHDAATLALAGAACTGLDWGAATTLDAGVTVRLGRPRVGVRSYLAVRGGIDAVAELGSCSTDTLSGLGPPPLAAGDRLRVGRPVMGRVTGQVTGAAAVPGRPRDAVLRLAPGPREDWFTADALRRLVGTEWVVRPDSNRIGIRLDGPALTRARRGELPSEPTLPGALQVPPDGRPILFGPDAPVTGGYPVIAVVVRADLDRAAQLRPGDGLRFRPVRGG